MKRVSCLIVALLLLCAASVAYAASEHAAATPLPAQTPAATAVGVEENSDVRPGPDKDLIILYTNDVHCGVDENLGYKGLAALRNAIERNGSYTALVDAGDFTQGDAIGTVSKGMYLIDIMNELDYDLAVPGNHEFDYGMDGFFAMKKQARFPILSCNFTDLKTDKPVLDAYKIIEFGGIKVAFVGICTPQTITSSTPTYFMDENKAYIYGFKQDKSGQALYDCVQAAVDAAKKEGAQYVIAVGHCGVSQSSTPWTSSEIIAATSGIDAFIDGHSHSVIEEERVKNKDGAEVLLTQTGTKLTHIGVLKIDTLGGISTRLVSDGGVNDYIVDIEKQFKEKLEQVVARTEVDLTITEPGTETRIVRNLETNLGDLCADACRTICDADVAIWNGGNVRANIPAGDITYQQVINVCPYGNQICVIEVTGQQLLDALEFGARFVPEESGGFLHVSGMTYEIHTNVPTSVKTDESKMFLSVEGDYRVQNVAIGGVPLDLLKTYRLAGVDYMLKLCGDGFTMFTDCAVEKDQVAIDSQAVIDFITNSLGGVVGDAYADPYGDGRITIITEEA